MLLATPGIVLHTTPYAESSVVAKVFTRQLGVQGYLIKGVRGAKGRVKQNLLQPLSCLDMVVYDNHRSSLGYIKEIAQRHAAGTPTPAGNALRFFMTEVLYKCLDEGQPMPELWDYAESEALRAADASTTGKADMPIRFLLGVAERMGVMPLDNHSPERPYFCLDEGQYVAQTTESTLQKELSALLHHYQSEAAVPPELSGLRRPLLGAMLQYYERHMPAFRNFTSHEILHTILN